MEIVVHGKNVEVTSALRDHVTRKLSKLNKLLDHYNASAAAVLSVEKERQIIEVTIPLEGGMLLRGEESTPDMYTSIDRVVDKLERQFDKFKTRMHRYRPGHSGHVSAPPVVEPEEPASAADLVRKKTYPRKPMILDEALMQMDLLGHDFFVFSNAETDSTNVLYRRRDGTYGLLEPR